ncbi:MAG: TlpA disulfide reductase family protein [Methylomonas sp.]|jgi:thiol-disulfide isomerase/thioredoxin
MIKIAMVKFLALLALTAGIAGCGPFGASAAPDAVFKTIGGESISVADLRGKPALITFWASNCPACLREMPDLIDLYRRYGGSKLNIVAVAMYYDPPNQVLNVVHEKRIPYAVALDPFNELGKAFGNVELTPTTFLLDKSGRIVKRTNSPIELAALQEQMAGLD